MRLSRARAAGRSPEARTPPPEVSGSGATHSPPPLASPCSWATAQGSTNCLITGLAAGTSNGTNDVDDGQTSIQSPAIALPAGRPLTLAFGLYFAHVNATSADLFRVRVVGENGVVQTVYARAGAASNVAAAWATRTANLDAWAGQTIQLRFDAIDSEPGSLIEAGVDNVAITAH